VVMSGYLLDHWQDPIEMPKSFSVFASHGLSDNVIPIQWARDSVIAVGKKEIDITFTEYPEGHGVSQQNFQDLITWLTAKNWA